MTPSARRNRDGHCLSYCRHCATANAHGDTKESAGMSLPAAVGQKPEVDVRNRKGRDPRPSSLNACGRRSTFPKLAAAPEQSRNRFHWSYRHKVRRPDSVHVPERLLLFPDSIARRLTFPHEILLFDTSLFVMNLAKVTTHVGTIPLAIA